MNIIKIKPGTSELRKYLYDALNSGFGFSNKLFKYIEKKHPDANGSFDPQAVIDILKNTIGLPEYLYFLADENEKRLSNKNIYTQVADLNLEDDLVVFEAYDSQIYYLHNGEGECLLGPCHDLDLGYGGLIQFRDSGGDTFFHLASIYDPEFHEYGEGLEFEAFPYTQGISYLDNIEGIYFKDPRVDKNKRNDRNYMLKAVKKNGWSLQFASAELQEDEELVRVACVNNPGSFLFVSEKLKSNKKFVAELVLASSGNILSYMKPDLLNSPEIVRSFEILEKKQIAKEKKDEENRHKKGFLPF